MIKPEMKKKMTSKQSRYEEEEDDYLDESSTSSPSHDKDSLASGSSASNNNMKLSKGARDDVKKRLNEYEEEDDESDIDAEDDEEDDDDDSRNNNYSSTSISNHRTKAGKEGKRKRWTVEEDEICRRIIEEEMKENPHRSRLDWKRVEMALNGSKNSHQCRERWRLRLDPKIRDNNWTIEEETLLLNLQRQHGNRWVLIASKIHGKSECACKSHYRSVLKRKKKRQANGTNSTSQSISSTKDSTETKKQRGSHTVSDDIDRYTSLPSSELPTVQLHPSPYSQQVNYSNVAFNRHTKRMKKTESVNHSGDNINNVATDAMKNEPPATTPSLIPAISSTPPQNVASALTVQHFHPYGLNHHYIASIQHYHQQQQLAHQQTSALYFHHLQQQHQQLKKANESATQQQQMLDYLQFQPQPLHIQAQNHGQILVSQPMLTIPPYPTHIVSNFQLQR